MNDFRSVVKEETPRLVVVRQTGPTGEDGYNWGVVHSEAIPPLQLIGYIVQLQARLPLDLEEENLPESIRCDESALVIAYTGSGFRYFIDPAMPVHAVMGMLELIRAVLVATKLAARPNRAAILGPDGMPVPRV